MPISTEFGKLFRKILVTCLLITAGSACAPRATPESVIQLATVIYTTEVTREVEVTREIEVTRMVERPVTVTPSFTPEYSPTPSLTPTITPTPSQTPTATPTPTYVVPRARVLMHAQCRYGPGVAYLYKYGLLEDNIMEIIGRMEILSRNENGIWEPAIWAYVQAIGGTNPCWVNAKLLEVTRGDLYSVPVTYPQLPFSVLYTPPASVSATRSGNEVTIFWSSVWMTEDDYRGYLIEAWICYQGQRYFTPVRSDALSITLPDEPGCFEPSSGHIYTAEKHGYTHWVPIPWPPFESTPTP